MEDTTLKVNAEKEALEKRVQDLMAENESLKEKVKSQGDQLKLLRRFCRYNAIKLNIEDKFNAECTPEAASRLLAEETLIVCASPIFPFALLLISSLLVRSLSP